MSYNDKKFLDQDGLVTLLKKLDNYPTNEILGTVVSAIQMSLGGKVGDVQINGTSIVDGGIANIPYAGTDVFGVTAAGAGLRISGTTGKMIINNASDAQIKAGTDAYQPITPSKQAISTFYGLAAAAGDTTQKSSSNEVGTYTADAKGAIRGMIGAISPAYYATSSTPGLVKPGSGIALESGTGKIYIDNASEAQIKAGVITNIAIPPFRQHIATFYGLAKAAGDTTQKESSATVGTYTDTAKQKIQNMLGITNLLSTEESSTATAAHALNSTFMMDGKLYKTTAAIVIGDAVVEGQNCEVVKADEVFVKNTDYASSSTPGIAKVSGDYGIMLYNNTLAISAAPDAAIKYGGDGVKPITASNQHKAVFYGLSKVAGVDLKNETVTVGTYSETSKTAIRSLIGAAAASDIPSVPVQDVQVNGTSVLSNSVANIPIAGSSTPGVVSVNGNGLIIENNIIKIDVATSSQIKTGTSIKVPPVSRQHESVFYGLTKAAGVDMSSSSNAVGTYTEAAKTAIRSMIGATSSNVIAVQDTQPTETDAKIWMMETAPESVEIPTMADLAGYVQKTDIATDTTAGIMKVSQGPYGVAIIENELRTSPSQDEHIQGGTNAYRPLTAMRQHKAVYFGLSKLAGVDLANETVTVGTYPETSKTAIRSLIGAIGTTDYATSTTGGTIRVNTANGVNITNDGQLFINQAATNNIKQGTANYFPIVPSHQHEAAFYGLAKAAGDTTMASSSNAVGTYTETAKAAIRNMLGIETSIELIETVSGTTPTIVGQPNVTYQCGEVSTISITPPANGTIDVYFTSGSTAAVLTAPSTIKWPAWFDVEALETNTIYELIITNGTYGSVMTWQS